MYAWQYIRHYNIVERVQVRNLPNCRYAPTMTQPHVSLSYVQRGGSRCVCTWPDGGGPTWGNGKCSMLKLWVEKPDISTGGFLEIPQSVSFVPRTLRKSHAHFDNFLYTVGSLGKPHLPRATPSEKGTKHWRVCERISTYIVQQPQRDHQASLWVPGVWIYFLSTT